MNTYLRNSALTLALSFSLVADSFAQQVVEDVVSMGPGYANQVFYNLRTTSQHSAPANNWDLAFEIPGISSGILVNEGKGITVYHIPNSTPDTFDEILSLDNIDNWERLHNSPEQWSLGALNRGYDFNTGNFGWGEYSMITHRITGTAVFVLVMPENTGAKKVFIESLAARAYTFKYANLDGSQEVQSVIRKADFDDRNFAYYDISEGKPVDREPSAIGWHLTFGRYVDFVSDVEGNLLPYGVVGVRSNNDIAVAKMEEGATSTARPSPFDFSFNINAIGHDWKQFSFASGWVIDNSTAYFVRVPGNEMYKIVFTDFTGAGGGQAFFTREALDAVSVQDVLHGSTLTAAVYPSIINRGDNARLVLDGTSGTSSSTAHIAIYNASGQVLQDFQYQLGSGLTQVPLATHLPAGAYFARLSVGSSTAMAKFIIR